MESKYAIIISIILGGLLGFGLTYIALSTQISAINTTINDLEDELENTHVTIQNLNNSISENFQSVNEDIDEINNSVNDLQTDLSTYITQTHIQISTLTSSITNNVNLLQQQIDDLKIEWEYIGIWTASDDIRTTSFSARTELRIQWWLDGQSWDSFVYVRIYHVNGTFIHAVGSSGWLSSNFADIQIDPGMYYLDITAYNVNVFFVDLWTHK